MVTVYTEKTWYMYLFIIYQTWSVLNWKYLYMYTGIFSYPWFYLEKIEVIVNNK